MPVTYRDNLRYETRARECIVEISPLTIEDVGIGKRAIVCGYQIDITDFA